MDKEWMIALIKEIDLTSIPYFRLSAAYQILNAPIDEIEAALEALKGE